MKKNIINYLFYLILCKASFVIILSASDVSDLISKQKKQSFYPILKNIIPSVISIQAVNYVDESKINTF